MRVSCVTTEPPRSVIIFVHEFIYLFVMVRKMGPSQGNVLDTPLGVTYFIYQTLPLFMLELAKGDLDFRISDLVKNPDGTDI